MRVVVLNYNRPQLTIRCARSLLQQAGVRVDLVVVDNWSNDAQLRDLRAGLPAGVTLMENPLNLGYSAGNNTGLRAKPSSAEFALVVNNDTILGNPRTLEQLVSALKGGDRYAACSPLVRDVGCGVAPERSIQVRRIPGFWELLVVSSSVLRRLPGLSRVYQRQVYADKRPFPLDSVVECETINGCCFLIRTDVLEAIGYLDEGTFLYCEELILGLQLRARGLGCALVTHSCVDHEQGASAGRNAAGATMRGMRRRIKSEVYFARKYLHSGVLAALLIRTVGVTDVLLKAVFSVFRSQSET